MLREKKYPLNTCLLQHGEVPDLAKRVALNQLEPYGGLPTLAYSKVFEAAREKGVRVLLDGQGSDEAWAGYDYYLKKDSSSLIQGVNSSPVRPGVLSQEFLENAVKPNFPKPFGNNLLDMQYRDIFYTKIPRALRFSDRISMMHSTELREPFLDYRLLEFVFSRPADFKIKEGVQKWLLRKIAGRFLNDDITLAPKRPLQTPQREWLGGNLKDWVYDHVNILSATQWFDHAKLKSEVDIYMKTDQDNSFFLWQWINTALIMEKP
jgi:asparagine synthase (glutamine-hydrolysing)